MTAQDERIEHDSLGELRVPASALYGAQTQRAIDNFSLSGLHMPHRFLCALGLIKAACARVNRDLGRLPPPLAEAIIRAANDVAEGRHDAQFPVDVFQTGSGTSTNMNANEVIAHLATGYAGHEVHPNDHVNMGQSSNDVIPTALHVSAALALHEHLRPALDTLIDTIAHRATDLRAEIKTGRTHLMDALPITLGQELGTWAEQLRQNQARLGDSLPRLQALAQGATAVGTGINAHPEFGPRVAAALTVSTGLAFSAMANPFVGLSCQDTAVEVSGHLRTLAVTLMKIANDLRWMNSGPLAGLGEIALPTLQPGSSIMPGKINPVIPEAVAMVCAQVMGNDATIAIGGQAGNFQLNVMLPVIAYNLLQSIALLANATSALGKRAIAGFTVNTEQMRAALERNPILITALNPVIGYEHGAAIAKRAYAEGRPVLEVALEMIDLEQAGLDEDGLRRLLDPARLTQQARPD